MMKMNVDLGNKEMIEEGVQLLEENVAKLKYKDQMVTATTMNNGEMMNSSMLVGKLEMQFRDGKTSRERFKTSQENSMKPLMKKSISILMTPVTWSSPEMEEEDARNVDLMKFNQTMVTNACTEVLRR